MAQSNVRRTVIREWMALSRDKQQSDQQARAFTKAALQRHQLPRSQRTPMIWLKAENAQAPHFTRLADLDQRRCGPRRRRNLEHQ